MMELTKQDRADLRCVRDGISTAVDTKISVRLSRLAEAGYLLPLKASGQAGVANWQLTSAGLAALEDTSDADVTEGSSATPTA